MTSKKARHRQPTADEQHVLEHLTVRLVRSEETPRFDELLIQEHYLHSAQLVGEHVRYVATYKGEWLALASWSAPALHLKARDQFIGWSEDQRRKRLALVVNNSRLLVLPQCHYPNLVSRFMKLMLGRLSTDWQALWKHPVVLAETFVDPQIYQGTAYKVSGWSELGPTSGWKRSAVDFYEKHERPKQVWVRELCKKACLRLRAPQLPAEWATVEAHAAPRCQVPVVQIRSLMDRLKAQVPEFRRAEGLAYPIAGMLALIALAVFDGVVRGPLDLADYAATLSQSQLRALGFRRNPHTLRYRHPQRTCFQRVLAGVDASAVEPVLLLWQEQVLGPAQNQLVLVDGKEIRHADVKIVNAVTEQGRWLGSTLIPKETNEIPIARQQLAKVDLVNKIVIADAIHTQDETARQILFEGGGDYLFTVKANQEERVATLETLLTEQRFSPSTNRSNPRLHAGAQSQSAGNPGGGLPGDDPGASGLSGSAHHRPAQAPGAAQGQEAHRNRLPDQQFNLGATGCDGLSQAQAGLLGD